MLHVGFPYSGVAGWLEPYTRSSFLQGRFLAGIAAAEWDCIQQRLALPLARSGSQIERFPPDRPWSIGADTRVPRVG